MVSKILAERMALTDGNARGFYTYGVEIEPSQGVMLYHRSASRPGGAARGSALGHGQYSWIGGCSCACAASSLSVS
jgi:hypothetical protein